MKNLKYIATIIILSMFMLPAFAIEDQAIIQESSSNMSEFSDYTGDSFFRSKFQLEKERKDAIKQQRKEYYSDFRSHNYTHFRSRSRVMPPLKKLRMKISKSKLKNEEEKLEKQKIEEKNISEESVDATDIDSEEEINEVLEEEASETQVMIRCKTMKYLPEENSMEATGDVRLFFPGQNTVMYSDRMTFDNINKIVQLYDSVKIVKDGSEILGDYMKINLNEESSFIEKPRASQYKFDISAENGYMFGDTIVSENGKIKSDNNNILSMRSEGFGRQLKHMIISDEEKSYLMNESNNHKFVVKVNELNIISKDNFDKIQLKHPKVYTTEGKKLFALPSMTFYTNKEHDYFEGNYPELGSFSGMGMFIGPGIVFEAPYGSTLKIVPTLNYKSKLGFGGIARFKNSTNKTDFAYNTAADRFTLKGLQQLDDHLYFQYGANTYLNNWFMGYDWIGYGGELLYERAYRHKDFLMENGHLNFTHRISAGFYRENEKNRSGDKFGGYHRMGTARFKYMAELNQTLFSLFNRSDILVNDDGWAELKKGEVKEINGWRQANFNLVGQASTALYGTGDTQLIGRIGPRLTTQYKSWRQDIGYFLTGYSDNTPLITMDKYRYASSNIYLREYWRVNKYLTLGFWGSYNLSDDAYDYQYLKYSRLREAAFHVALGPDDLKLNLGYDFIRKNTYFGLSMALNTKGSTLDYKKMTIKNPSGLGKARGETNNIESDIFVAPPSPYRSKAIVEELEDATTIMKGENI